MGAASHSRVRVRARVCVRSSAAAAAAAADAADAAAADAEHTPEMWSSQRAGIYFRLREQNFLGVVTIENPNADDRHPEEEVKSGVNQRIEKRLAAESRVERKVE